VEITNPIELGKAVDDKDFLLDVKCIMNDNTHINLEMQVINEHNWTERSLCYLCRTFDNLNTGEEYINAKTAIHISILNFTLFPDAPEFYATNMLMNIRNHKIYSSKFRLNVLDLTRTDLATDDDKKYHIDYWASLFKATTWEEINMLAQEDNMIEEASNTMYQLSQERMVRLQCEAREDFYRLQRTKDKCIQDLTKSNAEKDAIIANKNADLTDALSQIAELKAKLEAAGINY
jgi:predicted transposase/invertase (TIGR01784 family)